MVWRDDLHSTYASEDRIIEVVTVEDPFRVATVRYRDFDMSQMLVTGSAPATRWDITDDFVVPAGHYVIASFGEYVMQLHSVAVADSPPDFYQFAETEDFRATTCTAGCSVCEGEWVAESGSWTFRSTGDGDGIGWNYDDAKYHDETGTIACPVKDCTGRVGFNIS